MSTLNGLDISKWQPVTPSLVGQSRFWSKVDATGDCWIWTGALASGYGRFYLNGQLRPAHRVAYETLVGSIPRGLDLDHLCRVRSCVNPDHLEPVTRAENLRRGYLFPIAMLNLAKERCPHGHLYTFRRSRRWCDDCRAAARRIHAPEHRAARAAYARAWRARKRAA